jgi:hypothetical protein
VPVNLVAAGMAWRAATVDPVTSRAWRRCAVAFLAWWVGDVLWFVTEVLLGEPPFPSLADVGYLSVYPLLLWALLLFPVAPQGLLQWHRVWLDAATVTVGGFIVVWYLSSDRRSKRTTPAGWRRRLITPIRSGTFSSSSALPP